MTLGYNYAMVKEFEAGWAKFQRQEARREKIRKFLAVVGRVLAVAVVAGLGVIAWVAILLQPWEVGL